MAAKESATTGDKGRKQINPELFWLGAIILLAIAMRTIAALSREMVLMDESTYARMAENLLLGRAPWDITETSATSYSILYPFITSAFAVVTRNAVSAGYAVSVLFSSLMILPTYMFGKVMWNKRVATAAASVVAVLPVLVAAGSSIDPHNVFAFWLLSGVFFGYRMQFTKRCMCGMLAGTCLGLAYLTDPSALFYVAVLLVMLVIIGIRQEVASYANKAAAQFVVTFLVFAVGGIAWMSYQEGDLTILYRPVDQVYATVNGLPPGSIDYEKDVYGLDSSGEVRIISLREGKGFFGSLVEDPGAMLWSAARSAYNDYFRGAHSLIPVWLLPLIGMGMFKIVWTRREALKYGYFAIVLTPLLVLPAMWDDTSYILPYMGIAALLIARGWLNLEEWGTGTVAEIGGVRELSVSGKRSVHIVAAVLVLLPLVALSFWNVFRLDYPVELRQAGEWLAQRGEEDIRVMSRDTSAAYYADGVLVELPYASLEETLAYAREKGVDYLVVTRALVDGPRPQLVELMDPDADAADFDGALEAVYHENEGTEREIVIYRLLE